MKHPRLAVCSSASFYSQVIALSDEIEALGIEVILPKTARNMKQAGRKNEETITDWLKAPEGYQGKAQLIREHFNEITTCDAILVFTRYPTSFTAH